MCWAVFDFVIDEQGGVTIEATGTWETSDYCYAGEYASGATERSILKSSVKEPSSILKEMINIKYYAK